MQGGQLFYSSEMYLTWKVRAREPEGKINYPYFNSLIYKYAAWVIYMNTFCMQVKSPTFHLIRSSADADSNHHWTVVSVITNCLQALCVVIRLAEHRCNFAHF